MIVLACEVRAVDFTQDIEPIIQAHCIDCHGPDEQESQFRLDRLANMLSGGNSGEPAVVPGKPDESFLLKLIRHKEPGKEMPPDESLSKGEIELIEQWIADGAKTPESYGPAKADVDLSHWAFQPVKRSQSDRYRRVRSRQTRRQRLDAITRRGATCFDSSVVSRDARDSANTANRSKRS